MERNITKTECNQKDVSSRNSELTYQLIKYCQAIGVAEFCFCPGARNSVLLDCLQHFSKNPLYFFYEERSAAFFALGRARSVNAPVAVITTSGTAVGELLPAAMEGYYSSVPLLFITADRPKHFRGSGAPQSAEQKNIFGIYTPFTEDLESGEASYLLKWDKKYPAHLNLCFEESYRHSFDTFPDLPTHPVIQKELDKTKEEVTIIANYPFVIVGTLLEKDREAVLEWLKRVNSPVYCEATSGLRGHPELKSVAIYSINSLCNRKEYPIDHVLRVGGVPTARFWRDLEKKEGEMKVSSLSHLPFSGLSWGGVTHSSSCNYQILGSKQKGLQKLLDKDKEARKNLDHLLNESVGAEPWWIRELSLVIPEGSLVYLGNSQPIREWDLAATREEKHFLVEANRGVNGIDGQLSTFLGLARSKISNWAIVGDLTALYDLAAPWILSQLEAKNVTIVVINNSGGKIFSRLFENPSLQNQHDFRLKGLAELWKMDYLHCKDPSELEPNTDKPRIIECFPDEEATKQFWGVYKKGR